MARPRVGSKSERTGGNPISDKRDYTISVLASALRVLETFLEGSKTELSSSEISEALGLNRGRVFRILCTLESQGYVRQNPQTKRYRLGLKLFELGQAVARGFELPRAAQPILAELTETTGETSYVYALDGIEAVTIAKQECNRPMRIAAEVGLRQSLRAGAACNLLLAYLTPDQVDRALGDEPLPRVARNTLTDPADVKRKLAEIRRLGYHLSLEEYQDGVNALAAPICDASQAVVAAIAVAVPIPRFLPEKLPFLIDEVMAAAQRLSADIGCPSHALPTVKQAQPDVAGNGRAPKR